MDGRGYRSFFISADLPGNDDVGAGSQTIEQGYDQIDQGAGCPDGSQRCLSGELSDDDRVRGIEGDLQQIGDHQGICK